MLCVVTAPAPRAGWLLQQVGSVQLDARESSLCVD